MNIGVIGLGRMGFGMGKRLLQHGHNVFGYDISPVKRNEVEDTGITWVESLQDFGSKIPEPRVVLIMVPAGNPVDDAINGVASSLIKGDVIIDGGNSFYKDSIKRYEELKEKGLHFLDAGVSGGVWGLENGFCLMVGGEEEAFRKAEQVFVDLAPKDGYAYIGEPGAGHYAKMVHNGIEYGMLEAYGEGFEVLRSSQYKYDLEAMADLWNHGSVVRSWLLELAKLAFEESPDLADIRGWVADSGEGKWTVLEAIQESVPTPVIALSLMMRFRSRQDDSYSAKVIAALRNQFGGHAVKKE